MLIISWNINSIARRFDEVKAPTKQYSPDFLCLQKVRCNRGRERFIVDGYDQLCDEQDYGDWSGVTVYVRHGIETPQRIMTPELSADGHLQAFRCGQFALLNYYCPLNYNKVSPTSCMTEVGLTFCI